MEQNPSLQNLLFNIIYEVTSPNKTGKLEAHHMIGILSLTNLLGIVNYMNSHVPQGDNFPLLSSGSEGGGDMLQTLMQLMQSKKTSAGGGGGSDLNPQNLMLLLNVLSSLGKGKNEGDSSEPIKETM
ncbi:MAG: hypothetical protein ACM3QW_04760 [Ignavibacteriales bacterium]